MTRHRRLTSPWTILAALIVIAFSYSTEVKVLRLAADLRHSLAKYLMVGDRGLEPLTFCV